MPLPKKLDESIRKQFDELIEDGKELIIDTEQRQIEVNLQNKDSSVVVWGGVEPYRVAYGSFETRTLNLARLILDKSEYQRILLEVEKSKRSLNVGTVEDILGILTGLKKEYESGLLEDMSRMIEANVTFDFMSQAEQLLAGERHKSDHVPAAVLAGAVLEDAVRRQCERQDPPIETELQDGGYRKLDWMIGELQKRNLFNKPKSAQLRSWASIRNAAAHGRFDEFKRSDVEQMIRGVRDFMADYL